MSVAKGPCVTVLLASPQRCVCGCSLWNYLVVVVHGWLGAVKRVVQVGQVCQSQRQARRTLGHPTLQHLTTTTTTHTHKGRSNRSIGSNVCEWVAGICGVCAFVSFLCLVLCIRWVWLLYLECLCASGQCGLIAHPSEPRIGGQAVRHTPLLAHLQQPHPHHHNTATCRTNKGGALHTRGAGPVRGKPVALQPLMPCRRARLWL